MQKISVVAVGNLKDKFYIDAAAEYLKRLARFADVSVIELAEKTVAEEADKIIAQLNGYVIVLAVEGVQLSSEAFADKVKKLNDAGSRITFVIGSSEGLDARVKRKADLLLSFSKMTLPHRLMRVVLLEQLYRAFMIIGGGEYHK